MTRTQVNRLAKDTRSAWATAQKALEALGQIALRHDDPYLESAAGHLADAVTFLNGAAAKFERRGTDYPQPWFGTTARRVPSLSGPDGEDVPDIVGFLNGGRR